MTHHHLHSSPETCHWGFFEAKLKPVLTIASGDEVTVDTISGGPDVVPDRSQFHVPPELDEVHAKNERMLPGHILTGPIAVEGAVPGDVLEVEILDIQLRQDWGWNMIKPLAGTLPDDFHETPPAQHPARPRAHGRPDALGARSAPKTVLRGDGRGAAAGLGPHHLADPARDGRQSRQQGTGRRAPNSICRCSCRARCSPAATAMACRATARSASPRSRPRCRAVSG